MHYNFGTYPYEATGEPAPIKWRVLLKQEKSALLITEYGIDALPFFKAPPAPLSARVWNSDKDDPNHIENLAAKKSPRVFDENGNVYVDVFGKPITDKRYKGFPLWYAVTWENSTLRSFLNETFINTAFTSEERARLISLNVRNLPSPINQACSSGPDTQDSVAILDIENAKRYFPQAAQRKCLPTPYAESREGFFHHSDGFASWWLRTAGVWEQFNPKEDFRPANKHCISIVANDGIIDLMGMSAETVRCVRPIIHVRLKK